MAMMTFSVAMNGSSAAILVSTTFSLTIRPSKMFWSVKRIASAVKNASGKVIRLQDNLTRDSFSKQSKK